MPPDHAAQTILWPELDAATIARFADPASDLFASHLWFDLQSRAATPPGDHAACILAGAAAIPVWCRKGAPRAGQSSLYGLEFTPILPHDPQAAHQAGTIFAKIARQRGTLRLDGLNPTQPGLDPFLAGLATSGLIVQRFSHFGLWQAPVATDHFETWLATRPGALRSTITRKLKRARTTTHFTLIEAEPDLPAGIAAFEHVYARSWKTAEPYPSFNAACIRALASQGMLRLGILTTETGPIAAQYWAIAAGRAMLLKLAHDSASTTQSPGTILTAHMIETILRRDRPNLLDFGRGDDPYKRLWVDHRQERIGVLLINPRRPTGLIALTQTTLGTLRRRFRLGQA